MENDIDLSELIADKATADETADNLKFLESLGATAPEAKPQVAPAPVKAEPAKVAPVPAVIRKPAPIAEKPVEAAPVTDTAAMPEPDASVADAAVVAEAPPAVGNDTTAPDANLSDLEQMAADAPPPDTGAMSVAKSIVKDVARGATEVPSQVIGGALDAYNAIIGLGDVLNEAMPLPGFQLFDDNGTLNPEFFSAQEVLDRRKTESGKFLPTTDKAETVTGGMVRGLAQFLAGYRFGGNLLGGAGANMPVVRSTAQGLFSDLAAFDGHEQRLSNLIQSFPALSNPVTEYLSAEQDDSELEGRLKNAVEGLIPNTLFTGMVTALRAIRKARGVKAATGARTYAQAADMMADEVAATGRVPVRGTGDVFAAIGDSSPDAPLVKIVKTNLDASEATTRDLFSAGDDTAAKAFTRGAVPPTLPKQPVGKTFVNFAKFDTVDDIKAAIKDLSEANAEAIDDARRGIRTNEQTVAAASAKYDEVWTKLMSRRGGELSLNAEEQNAMRQLWVSAAEKTLDMARLAEAEPTIENLLSFRKMVSVFDAINKNAQAVRTETARALQQWNIPVGVGGKAKVDAMHNILLQHGGADVTIDLARKFSGLAEEVAANPEKMAKIVKAVDAAGAKTINAINEVWIGLGLLSGPKTHVRNIISNTSMMLSSIGERAIAARAEGLIDDKTAIAIGEATAQASGIFSNVRKAWTDAAETFRTGIMKTGRSTLDNPPEMMLRQFDYNTPLGKALYGLSYAPGTVFKGLQAADQFFKTLNFEGEMAALAHREAVRAAQRGDIPKTGIAEFAENFISKPTNAAIDDAMEAAARRTFTSDPGKVTKYILRGRQQFPLLKFVIPFVNTPSNVLQTGLEFSPLAPLAARFRRDIAKGGAAKALALTRMGIGTSAMLAFVDMSIDGKITGSGPDPGTSEYEALRRTGWRPYTIRIGNKWVSYRGVDPITSVMGMGADIGDYVRYADDDLNSAEAIKDMMAIGVFSMADNVLDRSFLKGLADTISAVTDPERYGPSWIDSFASSFIPRGLTEVRNVADTTVRDARTMMDSFKNRIPWLSMTVPEKRDEWGRTISMNSGWGKAYDAMSPFYASEAKAEPIDEELIRQGFGAGHAQRAMRLEGVNISFRNRADIHNRYLELRGQTKSQELSPALVRKYGNVTMLDVLNGMVTGDHPLARKYAGLTDGEGGEKHKLIQKVVRDFGRAARERLVEEFPEIRDQVAEEENKRKTRASDGQSQVDDLIGADR